MKRYCIITIEREYASGGSLVGKLVGQALGIPVYGREILEIAAREGGTTPEYIEHLEETNTNSLLYSLVAQEGPCVIVGRCAGWVLREQPHVLNVFIHADRQERLRRAVEEYGIPQDQAASVLHRFDHRRSNFYHANTGRSWREREGYHMVLDSGLLGVELCSQLLVAAAQSEG